MNWPTTLVPYHRTPTFDEESVPDNLLAEHNTKAGVWALLRVLEGKLVFIDLPTGEQTTLDPNTTHFIEPEQPHCVKLDGPVRFYLEFFRDASA